MEEDLSLEVRQDVVIDESELTFSRIPNVVIELFGEELGAYGIAVFIALKFHANYRTKSSFVLVKTIAKKFNIGESTVRREIAKLEKIGLVRVTHRMGKSSVYTITNPASIEQVSQYLSLDKPRYIIADTPLPYSGIKRSSLKRKTPTPSPSAQDGELILDGGEDSTTTKNKAYAEWVTKYHRRVHEKDSTVPSKLDFIQLHRYLKQDPDMTPELLRECLQNRIDSDNANLAEPIHRFIYSIRKYEFGPLDRYGKPKKYEVVG